MSEEDQNIMLEPEEVQEIINWAISAGAMITLMKHAPEHENAEEAIERLEGYIQAIDIMYDNLPDSISETAHEVASDSIEEAEKQEALVEDFRRELDELDELG